MSVTGSQNIDLINTKSNEALAKIAEDAETARKQVISEYSQQRDTVRRNIGMAESTLQSALQDARNQAQQLARQRLAGVTTARPTGQVDVSQFTDLQSRLRKLRYDIDQSESMSLSDIDEQVRQITADIEDARDKSIEAEKQRIAEENARILAQQQQQALALAQNETQRLVQEQLDKTVQTTTEEVTIIGYSPTTKEVLVKTADGKQKWIDEALTPEFTKLSDEQKQEAIEPIISTQTKQVNIDEVVFDYETGKYFDVTNPAKPQEVIITTEIVPQTIRVPDTKSETVIETIGNVLNNVWQSLTPWDESAGEQSVIDAFNRIIKSEAPTQEKLKAAYEAEEAMRKTNSWWQQILFNSPTVIKNPDGTYSAILGGASPMVGGGQAVKQVVNNVKPFVRQTVKQSAKEVGMSEVQFSTFIRQRVYNPSLTPEQFLKTVSAFEIINKILPTVRTTVVARGRPITPPKIQAIPTWKERAETVRISEAIRMRSAVSAQDQASYINKANQATVAIANVTKSATEANQALLKAIQSANITTVIKNDTAKFLKAFTIASPEIKQSVLNNVSNDIASALTTNNATQLKMAASEQLKIQQQYAKITDAVANYSTKLKLQGNTAIEMQQKLDNFVKNQLDRMTGVTTSIKTQVKNLTKTLTKTATETLTKVQTKVQTKTQVKTKLKGKERITPKKTIAFTLKLEDGSTVELSEKEYKGMVAWKQGIMYILIYPPYDKAHTIYQRKPIEGVKYLTGIGSAAKSLIAKNGSIPQSIKGSMGIVTFDIAGGRNQQKPTLTFARKNIPTNRRKDNESITAIR